jgi:hypothetical protein
MRLSIKRLSGFMLLFLFLFAFRTFYGLMEAQWGEKDDLQTYLIGLKCYTTGTWPYFGPDVNGREKLSYTSQIPGALEGLLIAASFHVLPLPEAPFLEVNLLSTAGAALLAWYIRRRLPNLSFPWLFLWVCITPWSLFEGTHVINPAFDFLPSVLFFIGFLESLPSFSTGWLTPFWRNAWMGFSVFWVMQFHFSYVYLLPFAVWSLGDQIRGRKDGKPLLYFALGAAPMLALIAPTLVRYGLGRGDVASGFAVPFNVQNLALGPTILARCFSLVCFELPRFLGVDTRERLGFLPAHPLLALPCAVLWIAGLLQPLFMLACWFKGPWAGSKGSKKGAPVPYPFLRWFQESPSFAAWRGMRLLVLALFLLVWASFWFTLKLPLSHIYMVCYPLLMLYSCYCWSLLPDNPRWRTAAKVFLLAGLYFQVGHAFILGERDSLYRNRVPAQKAIQEKDYHLFGERRPESIY